MRPVPWRLACLLALGLTVRSGAAPSTVTVDGRAFQVEEGFTLEKAAGSDLAPRPVSASFDDRGRLYVTDSSGSNLPPAEQLKNPTHRILRLEDTNNDGRFDKSVVFAEKVMFPQGCLWHDGWVYVAGLASQGCGYFGGMLLMRQAPHSLCVPLNRAASVLAGLLASCALGRWPSRWEIFGALVMTIALAVGVWPVRAKRAARLDLRAKVALWRLAYAEPSAA